jgi:hypothetical protein
MQRNNTKQGRKRVSTLCISRRSSWYSGVSEGLSDVTMLANCISLITVPFCSCTLDFVDASNPRAAEPTATPSSWPQGPLLPRRWRVSQSNGLASEQLAPACCAQPAYLSLLCSAPMSPSGTAPQVQSSKLRFEMNYEYSMASGCISIVSRHSDGFVS